MDKKGITRKHRMTVMTVQYHPWMKKGGIAPFRPSNSMPMTKNRCLENSEHRFCCTHNETALNQASLRCNNDLCTEKIPLQGILSFDFLASRKGLTYGLRRMTAYDPHSPRTTRTTCAARTATRDRRVADRGASARMRRRTARRPRASRFRGKARTRRRRTRPASRRACERGR